MAKARIAAIIVMFASASTVGAASSPLGAEFQVNTHTVADQGYPIVCRAGSGAFVVTWEAYGEDGDSRGIGAQRFGADGQPLGSEFVVNEYTPGAQQLPDVACDEQGGFVVAWESLAEDGDGYGIFARRYDGSGAPRGGEFQANSYTTERQLNAGVCIESGGGFVVTWHSYEQDGYSYGVFGQRFASDGGREGGEFQVNTYTLGTQEFPSTSCAGQGGFVVVWHSDLQDGYSYGVFGQRFGSDGSSLGTEFQVNTYTYDSQQLPNVAAGTNGEFVVVWESYGYQDGDSYGVFGRRFASDGTAQGEEFQVNAYTLFSQEAPQVSLNPSGDFVVAWSSSHDGDGYGVFAQCFASDGARVGGEFQVNTYTLGYQGSFTALGTVLSIDGDAQGNFVVVWQSVDLFGVAQDGDGFGVFGQRFTVEAPQSCPGDINGDGKVELNELIVGVGIALGQLPVSDGEAFDLDGNGVVTINELIAAIDASLGECAA
jgi:hypothetical protein